MNFHFSPVESCLQNDNVAYETKGAAIQPDSPIFVTVDTKKKLTSRRKN